MDNSTTVIHPPPPQPQPPFFPQAPSPDNTINGTIPPPPPPPFSAQIIPFQNTNITIINIKPPPPLPFPDSPNTVDLSPLEFILALMAVITIPALIYAFFFAIKCPPWPSRHRHSRSAELPSENSGGAGVAAELSVSGVKYQKEAHVKEIGSECPVCLSVFADGEEVRQLSVCKHSFHATCIDMWLSDHSNCPICRATVAGKRPSRSGAVSATRGSDRDRGRGRYTDLHQGLPDAANLV